MSRAFAVDHCDEYGMGRYLAVDAASRRYVLVKEAADIAVWELKPGTHWACG